MFKKNAQPEEVAADSAAPAPEIDLDALIEQKVWKSIQENHHGSGRPVSYKVLYSPIEELAQKMGWNVQSGYPADLEEIMTKQDHGIEELLGWDVEALAELFDANTSWVVNPMELVSIKDEFGALRPDRFAPTPEERQVRQTRPRPRTPKELEQAKQRAEEALQRDRRNRQLQHLETKAEALRRAEEEFRAAREGAGQVPEALGNPDLEAMSPADIDSGFEVHRGCGGDGDSLIGY